MCEVVPVLAVRVLANQQLGETNRKPSRITRIMCNVHLTTWSISHYTKKATSINGVFCTVLIVK